MLNDFSALAILGREVQAMVRQNQNESIPLEFSKEPNAYNATANGLGLALQDIETSQTSIRENFYILGTYLDAAPGRAKSELRKYVTPTNLQHKSPNADRGQPLRAT